MVFQKLLTQFGITEETTQRRNLNSNVIDNRIQDVIESKIGSLKVYIFNLDSNTIIRITINKNTDDYAVEITCDGITNIYYIKINEIDSNLTNTSTGLNSNTISYPFFNSDTPSTQTKDFNTIANTFTKRAQALSDKQHSSTPMVLKQINFNDIILDYFFGFDIHRIYAYSSSHDSPLQKIGQCTSYLIKNTPIGKPNTDIIYFNTRAFMRDEVISNGYEFWF